LTVKHKDLEANYSALWKRTKAHPNAKLDSNYSTSEACSRCSKFDKDSFETNLAKLEETIKSKNKEIDQLNMLVKQGRFGAKSIPKVMDKQGFGHYKDNKVNGRKVVKVQEIPLWNMEGYPNTIMDIGHGVTTSTTTRDKPKSVNTTKEMVELIPHQRHRRMWWNTSLLQNTLVTML
jgi:hypothetical protein